MVCFLFVCFLNASQLLASLKFIIPQVGNWDLKFGSLGFFASFRSRGGGTGGGCGDLFSSKASMPSAAGLGPM